MTQIVEPKPIYRALTEEEVRKGLNDPDPLNPIAIELTRLVMGYTSVFSAYIKRAGYVPPQVLYIKARWPIEKVAVELMTETVQAAIAEAPVDKSN